MIEIKESRKPAIVIVDDEPANLIAFQALLQPFSYPVFTARSGPEVLCSVVDIDPVVILLDVMMPGMDGFETAKRLREIPASRKTPLIFVTAGSPDRQRNARAYQLGAVDFLYKPVDADTLLAKVRVFVELHEGREKLRRMGKVLEQRVAERTRELATANARLKEEIERGKRVEGALQAHSKELVRSNEELQRFAYVASHDLKEPLRMVSNYVQLLKRRYHHALDPDADAFIDYAVTGVKRMYRLIDDLIEYARVGRETELETVDCNEVFEQAKANLQQAISESEATIESEPLPSLSAVRTSLLQLFQNLLANAIKFRSREKPRVRVVYRDSGESAVFSVQDNGIGIDKQYADKIFEIFQRLHGSEKYPGSGIGLAVCKKIVSRHGGEIWFESDPGCGTTFHFSLLKAPERLSPVAGPKSGEALALAQH